jgi:hypothetical protein
MMSEQKKILGKYWLNVFEVFPILAVFFMMPRFTALLALVLFALLYLFYRIRHRKQVLALAVIFYMAALLIPADIYVPGFGSSLLMHSEHRGLRFVPVLYGYGAHRRDGGEYFSGGCCVGINDTRWKLVWD